jgi:CheY-like chemotaxis protein
MKDRSNGDRSPVDPAIDRKPTFGDFYNLMRFKVTKILLVSSLYDAFTLEEDGLLIEQISEEYHDLALSSPPQVVRVPSGADALRELRNGRYDLIITMSQVIDLDPCEFCRQARHIQEGIPVVLLATSPEDAPIFERPDARHVIDKVFYWTGDSALFLAIIKYVEDRANIEADTAYDVVKAILVIEDSPLDYSSFLPILYTEIMRQTHALIAEGLTEQEKWFRKKARPKILLAETFEEARELYTSYRKDLLAIITDVTYPRSGRIEDEAGFQFIEEIVEQDIPVLIQSHHSAHREGADRLGMPFLNKHSETLAQGIRDFLKQRLGFGDFVFIMPDARQVARVSDINEFVEKIQKVPLESIRHHGARNDFSRWLMARGEMTLARQLRPKRVSDFRDDAAMKEYLIQAISKCRQEKRLGTVTDFYQETFEFEETFTRLGGGSLGGKGRGLAFLALLLRHSKISDKFGRLRVRLPDTLVIGTDTFDRFMADNDLYNVVSHDLPDSEMAQHFMGADLPGDVVEALRRFLLHVSEPLAVRSSSLLEDSQTQPFAGVYATYMLPNNCADETLRLGQLCQAVKLVYASTFSRRAKAYIQAAFYQAEEKMAIVIQKVVGKQYGGRFYPLFSGVAQSCNFYPVAPLEREDGLVSLALGLGRIVVEGGKVLSFSPAYPEILPGLSTAEEIFENTQSEFYSLDLRKTDFDLSEGEESTLKMLAISDAESDGTLEHIASTYDVNDNRLREGVLARGPKVLTFSGIRKFNMLPLVEVIRELLAIGQRGMGRHVEIEFAGTQTEDGDSQFYALQIRPLVTLRERQQVVIEDAELENALMAVDNALGNGVLEHVSNVVLVDPDAFDATKTIEIAREIGEMNRKMDGSPYILIGPGRWGTRDRFAGIPVRWEQISWARTIVEMSLKDFRVAPSHGSHFFHNITSLGVMYLSLPFESDRATMRWNDLMSLPAVTAGHYARHIRLPYEVAVKVDGKTGRGVVLKRSGRPD